METYLKNLDAPELQKARLVIGQFINSCSHSMRGPLKSMTGLVTLLQEPDRYSREEANMFLSLIDKTINKMEHTLDELEYFLENSTRDITLKAVNCNELLSTILEQHTEELTARNIKVNLTIEQTIPFLSDSARLRVLLNNIVSNAIQFRDVNKDNHQIDISVAVTNLTATFSVTDNGIGIARENHLKIFQLFFRASEKSSGTGVGLYVVKEIIEKMNGSVIMDSKPGRGTVFRVTIPNLI